MFENGQSFVWNSSYLGFTQEILEQSRFKSENEWKLLFDVPLTTLLQWVGAAVSSLIWKDWEMGGASIRLK